MLNTIEYHIKKKHSTYQSVNCSNNEAFQIMEEYATIVCKSGAHDIVAQLGKREYFRNKAETLLRRIELLMDPNKLFIQTEPLEMTREFLMGTVSTSNSNSDSDSDSDSNSNSNSPVQILTDDLLWMTLEHVRTHTAKTRPVQYELRTGVLETYTHFGGASFKSLRCVSRHDHELACLQLVHLHYHLHGDARYKQDEIELSVYRPNPGRVERLRICYDPKNESRLISPVRKIEYVDNLARRYHHTVTIFDNRPNWPLNENVDYSEHLSRHYYPTVLIRQNLTEDTKEKIYLTMVEFIDECYIIC